MTATLTFQNRDQAQTFATDWAFYSKKGYSLGSGTENVEVTIQIEESDKKWIDSYAERLNNQQIIDLFAAGLDPIEILSRTGQSENEIYRALFKAHVAGKIDILPFLGELIGENIASLKISDKMQGIYTFKKGRSIIFRIIDRTQTEYGQAFPSQVETIPFYLEVRKTVSISCSDFIGAIKAMRCYFSLPA